MGVSKAGNLRLRSLEISVTEICAAEGWRAVCKPREEGGQGDMSETSNCVIVIPALNPPNSFPEYIRRLREHGFDRIVVVNDGSRTDKLPVFFKVQRAGATVLTHETNRGVGAALKTGFRYYEDNFHSQTDGIITLNCDRLTAPEDVEKVASSLHNEQAMGSYAIVVGSRDFTSHQVTDYDYRMNGVMKLCYHMLMGVRLSDPMSGVYGIPDLRVQHCIDVEADGYEYSTALLMSFEKIGFLQVPVPYTVYEPTSEKTRKSRDTFRIVFTLIRKFVLYSVTSLMATVVDLIMFSIFTNITFRGKVFAILYGTICARLISASVNYILTKHFVFHFKSDNANRGAKSAGEFMALSAAQCLCSAFVVSVLNRLLGGSATGIKVLTDLVLFFVSYKIQHKYIFKDDKKPQGPDEDLSGKAADAEGAQKQTMQDGTEQGGAEGRDGSVDESRIQPE